LRPAPPNLTMHPATARCRLAVRPLVWLPPSSPAPFIIHLVASLQSTHLSLVHGSTAVALESSSVLCRNRAAILVALIAHGVICHARMTHQDACQAELVICQAALRSVGAKKTDDVLPLAAVIAEAGTPVSASQGALERHRFVEHACAQTCTCARGQPLPWRVRCARCHEHERRGAAGRHCAASRVERNQLRRPAAGLSSAQQCAYGRDEPG
jgi:hypothetical protein